ncbi:unnamed protein product [Effrenium voratum]|nr:unnamed protein product [Effrenium voratum]
MAGKKPKKPKKRARPRKKRCASEGEGADAPPPSKRPKKKAVSAQEEVLNEASATAKEYRSEHEIQVRGACPAPVASFQQARSLFGQELVEALREQGYSSPTPVQAQAWPIAVRGHDLIGVAKTGSGKTCAYLIPALALIAKRGPPRESLRHDSGRDDRPPAQPSCLIMAPTRELVQQIGQEAKKFAPAVGARAQGIFGGVAKGPQVKALKCGVDLLSATPGRLKDFMTGDAAKDAAPVVLVQAVTYLVLDEADRMLDMGFEPEMRQIIAKCPDSGPPQEVLAGEARQTLFFTATWPRDVQRNAMHFTRQALRIQVGQHEGLATNASIRQKVAVVKEHEKLGHLKQVISSELKPGETCVVFCGKKDTCDILEKELTWDPLGPEPPLCAWCRALHGDKEQKDRYKALSAFRAITESPKKGQKGVLIATDVAARGLDIPGVALVVIFDYAESCTAQEAAEAYVHRIGRTGRAGKEGRAITFFDPEKDVGAEKLAELLRASGQDVPPQLRGLAEQTDQKVSWISPHGFCNGSLQLAPWKPSGVARKAQVRITPCPILQFCSVIHTIQSVATEPSRSSTDKILSAEALCQVSVSSKVFGDVLCASDLGSACDTKVKQIQNTVVKESSDVQRSRITARSLPRMSLQESESAYNWDEVPTESVSEEEWLEEEIDAEVSTPEAGSLRPAQEERRIKSMSPARRWRRPRPQPFLHLEKALNTVQPSSAPADADRPLAQLNGGLGEEAPPEAEKREAQPEPRGEEALTHLRPLKSNVWYM